MVSEDGVFQIGRPDPRQRRRRIPYQESKTPLLYPPFMKFSLKHWYILPAYIPCHQELILRATGLRDAYTYADTMEDIDNPFPATMFSQKFLPKTMSPFIKSGMAITSFKEGLRTNIWCRHQFLKLYTRWRIRRFKAVNDTDPVTLESPMSPVRLYDWNTFSLYIFDAKTVMRDMSEKLLHRDEMFPLPSAPRNPLTNEDYTQGQMWGLVEQLRRYGKTNWVIEAYAKCSFDLDHFKEVYAIPLNKSALQRVFSDIRSHEVNDILLDFIEAQHNLHNVEYNKNLYRWAALKSPMNQRLSAWRDMCYRYYLNTILYTGDPAMLSLRQTTDIYYPSLRLCSTAKEIYQAQMMETL